MGLEFFDAKHVYLDKISGNFTPSANQDCIQIDNKVYEAIKNICTQQNEKTSAQETTLKQAIRLLHNILLAKFGEDIKSFSFI